MRPREIITEIITGNSPTAHVAPHDEITGGTPPLGDLLAQQVNKQIGAHDAQRFAHLAAGMGNLEDASREGMNAAQQRSEVKALSEIIRKKIPKRLGNFAIDRTIPPQPDNSTYLKH